MPQAIPVESPAEQQGWAGWHEPVAARSAGGEFALDGGEDGLDQGAPSLWPAGEGSPHFRAHSVEVPRLVPAHGRNDAASTALLADLGMVPCPVKLRIG